MTTEDDVRRIALSLPGTLEKPYDHLPGFYVGKKLFARIRTNPDALVAFTRAIEEKQALIEAEPDKFFQIPHYEGHPALLVRLEAVTPEDLEEILTLAWSVRATEKIRKLRPQDV